MEEEEDVARKQKPESGIASRGSKLLWKAMSATTNPNTIKHI